jgi:hypothetical protein
MDQRAGFAAAHIVVTAEAVRKFEPRATPWVTERYKLR